LAGASDEPVPAGLAGRAGRAARGALAPALSSYWFPLTERIIADTGCPVPTTDVFVNAWLANWRSAEQLRNDDLSPVLLPLAVARPEVPLIWNTGRFAPRMGVHQPVRRGRARPGHAGTAHFRGPGQRRAS
jgi:hypothetical protein